MDSNKEVKRLMDEWDLSEKQAHLLNNAFENDNLDAMKFYNIMKDDDFETGSLSEAMSNVLTGIELSWTEILSITDKHGIKQINPAGEKFDYNFHQAMFEKHFQVPLFPKVDLLDNLLINNHLASIQ